RPFATGRPARAGPAPLPAGRLQGRRGGPGTLPGDATGRRSGRSDAGAAAPGGRPLGATQLSPAGQPRYSARTIEHFRHPRNVGRLEHANAVGSVDDRATENFISFYLLVEAGRIVAARFRTFGCSACIAASSALTELVEG